MMVIKTIEWVGPPCISSGRSRRSMSGSIGNVNIRGMFKLVFRGLEATLPVM